MNGICQQALLFGRAKRAARERASRLLSRASCASLSRVPFSRYPPNRELARRLRPGLKSLMRSWGYILLIFLATDPTVTKRFTVFFRWQKILIISNEVLDTKWFRCERTQKAWQASSTSCAVTHDNWHESQVSRPCKCHNITRFSRCSRQLWGKLLV